MINIENLRVSINQFTLKDINLDIADGEYLVMVGPTGAGKTVLLETIAGLYTSSAGKIIINGKDVTRAQPESRGVSIVYQDCALFPHLSVKDNILFGLKVKGYFGLKMTEILDWLDSLLTIRPLLHRQPITLSGGERQRVALARGLATKPGVLLLDEPISSLDTESREEIRGVLRTVHRQQKITILHVTHDFEEAMSLGDRVAVINSGEILQVGSPRDVFYHPVSEFVARFTLARNIFSGNITRVKNGVMTFQAGNYEIAVASMKSEAKYAVIRPEMIQVTDEKPSLMGNVYSGIVSLIEDRGAVILLDVDCGLIFKCLIHRQQFEKLAINTGQPVYASFTPAAVHLI